MLKYAHHAYFSMIVLDVVFHRSPPKSVQIIFLGNQRKVDYFLWYTKVFHFYCVTAFNKTVW